MSRYLTEEPDPDPWGDSLLIIVCRICGSETRAKSEDAVNDATAVCDRCWRRAMTTQERKAERGAA